MSEVHLDVLNAVRVASPCTMRWDEMRGSGICRHCDFCGLNVYNLSAMSRQDAAELVERAGDGRLCVTFFRRADGMILTEDCPRGMAAVRARGRQLAARLLAAAALVCSAVVLAARARECRADESRLADLRPFAMLRAKVASSPTPLPTPLPPTFGGTQDTGRVARVRGCP